MLLLMLCSISISMDSPIVDNLEYLEVRGLIDLPTIRPYEMGDITVLLKDLLMSDIQMNRIDKRMIAYFSPLLNKPDGFYELTQINLQSQVETNRQNLYVGLLDIRFAGRLYNSVSYHNAVGIRWANELDTLGPRPWRNFQAYLNDGFLKFKKGGINFDIGRRNFLLGPGDQYGLLLCPDYQGYDGYLLLIQSKPIEFYNIFSCLDAKEERYISCHRIGIGLKNHLKLGFSEAILFAREIEPLYLNPFLPYYLSQWGTARNDNIMWCFDAQIKVFSSICYGEFLIDDYMYEDDPYPDKLAYQIGIKSIPREKFLVKINYIFVDKWVYTHKIPVNTYEKDSLPLGFPLGNDVDEISLFIKYLTVFGLNPSLHLNFTRKGEGSIFLPYEEEGGSWSPPFPSGNVEKNLEVKFGVDYSLRYNFYLRLSIGKRWIRNYQNIKAEDFNGLIFQGQVLTVY